ncbi:MAG: hypothetical protein HY866_12495 [Chloroflexi bacterium]|nr:hypothetical protein [Chloroflexota bacterium]
MRYVIVVLLLLAAHFSLTPFAPAPEGKDKFYWPFAADSKPALDGVGGLPSAGGLLTIILAAAAGLGFLLAAAGVVFGINISVDVWRAVVLTSAVSSVLLYLLYVGVWSILPIALDIVVTVGVLVLGWSNE